MRMFRRGAWAVAVGALVLVAGLAIWAGLSRVPVCGEAGEVALRDAVGDLHVLLPALVVDSEVHRGDCGLDGTTFALWSYPGLATLQDDGRAAGCTLGDITKYEDEPFLSCPVRRGSVVLLWLEDYDGSRVAGSLALK